MPCLDILIDCFLTPGAKLGVKIGTTYSIIIMLLLHFISLIILYFGNKFYLLLISISAFGLGTGLSQITYMRNSWKYFPEHQGLVNGIMISSAGIASTFLTVLADFVIVNPERKNTYENGIYPKDIADNMGVYIKVICGVLIALDILGFLLTFDYNKIPEDGNQEQYIKKDNIRRKTSLDTTDINYSSEKTYSTSGNQELSGENKKMKLMDAFCSKCNCQLFSFCFCGFCKQKHNIIINLLFQFLTI
jgi:hypothetical protein